jgi:hypothetical protein
MRRSYIEPCDSGANELFIDSSYELATFADKLPTTASNRDKATGQVLLGNIGK